MSFDYYTFEDPYSNYTYDENQSFVDEPVLRHVLCFNEISCVALIIINVVIFLLGFCGNGLVIWIAGFKMKKRVNTTWYLSLAISDFIFCACLPFGIVHMYLGDWIFGLFMCKVTSFVMFLNMFSSIFLLAVISGDRCLFVIFPVWSQNHRTVRNASVAVVLAWLASVAFSIPSLVFRDTRSHLGKTTCFNNYTSDQYSHKVVAVSRFLGGFVAPFFAIVLCYSVIIVRLKNSRMAKSTKPFKVMTALIATFFVCWLPYHVFILLELTHQDHIPEIITMGLKVGASLATANSFLNPLLYVFMGDDFKSKFRCSLLSKMENAMGEEGRTTSRYLSRSSSVGSTHI